MIGELPSERVTATDWPAKILVVDDRPENLATMEAVLEPLGEEIVRAQSGFDALRQLLRHDFAVVLMDAKMPTMSGFETAEMIRQREKNRHLPIIFVTAYNRDRKQVFQGYSVGAVDYITKPFDPDILRSKVKVFVDLYKQAEEIKRQQEFIRDAELREQARQMEQQHMRELAQELEGRVAERTAQLVAANEELQGFCYSVSHDLRTPLRAIVSSSRILLEDAVGRLTPDQVETLQRQASAATRLGTLIDDLLQLSRLGRRELVKKEVDLTTLARDVSDELLTKDWCTPPEVHVDEGIRAVADPELARLLLMNLIDNAIKYSPAGGRVHVGIANQNGNDCYFVRDEGIGFEMKYANKIFLPFERLVLDSEYPGTGIGLASVERIARRHGGRVWVESSPGVGSTFWFTLGESPRSALPQVACVL